MHNKSLGAIILAAGKGKRLRMKDKNKVTLPLGDKPMIAHAAQLLRELSIQTIVVVVGFAKGSVMRVLGDSVRYTVQQKRLGTAHAALCGVKKLPEYVTDVLIFQGDDSAFYKKELIQNMIEIHEKNKSKVTFMTIEMENPFGLGRIVRNKAGDVTRVVEEKDATESERRIKEVNPACYMCDVAFLNKYLPKITKSPITGEYYLPQIIDLALKNNERIQTYQAGRVPWRGVNTAEELQQAQVLFTQQ